MEPHPSEQEHFNFEDTRRRFAALRLRAVKLRALNPYRYYKFTEEQVRLDLEKNFIPSRLGWEGAEIKELEQLLGTDLPEDYKVFLEQIGKLHPKLFGCDYKLVDPRDYIVARDDIVDTSMEQWDIGENHHDFIQMMSRGVFIDGLGGFQIGYLLPFNNISSRVKYWVERDKDNPSSFHDCGTLISFMEHLMGALERRVLRDNKTGYLKIKGHMIPGSEEFNFTSLAHKNYIVELDDDLKAKIQFVFRGVQFD